MLEQLILVDGYQEFFWAINEYDLESNFILFNNNQTIQNVSSAFEKERIGYNVQHFPKDKKLSIDDFEDKRISSDRVVLASNRKRENTVLALYQAKLTGASLKILDCFEDSLELIQNSNYRYYTLLFDKEEMNLDTIYRINSLQITRNEAGKAFYYGFLVARNPFILNAQIVKNHAFKRNVNEKYVLVDRVDYLSKEFIKNEYATTISYHHADVENIQKEFCSQTSNAVTIIGHGRDDVIWLKDGCICGKSKQTKKRNVDLKGNKETRNYPACNYHDYCLMKQGKIINIFDISARHFFVNACESSKLEECVFSEDYNASYSFLEGHGISYIGCNQTIMGEPVSNYYYIAQLKAGIPLGKIVFNLSEMYRHKGGTPYESYFLLGDPTFGEREDVNRYCINKIFLDDETKHELIIKKDTSIVSIEFPEYSVIEDFYNLKIKIWAYIKDKRLFGTFRRSDKHIYLDIFSKDLIHEGDQLTVVISGVNVFNVNSMMNTNKLLELNIFDKNLKLALNETKDVSSSFINSYIFKMNTLDSVYKDVYRKQEKLYKRLKNLNKDITTYLVNSTNDKGFCFEEVLRFNGMKYVGILEQTEEVCRSCGRRLQVSITEHNYYKNIRRKQYYCPVCSFIKDVPDSNVNMYFHNDSHYCTDELISEIITVKNESDEIITGYVGIAIVSGKDISVEYVRNCVPIEVRSGKSAVVECKYKFNKNTRPHQYWLKGYASLNGEVYVIKKDVWIYE